MYGGSRTIIDPFGRIVNSQTQWAAQYTGVYTVLIEAALPPTQTWSYRLSHQPIMGPSAIAAGGLPLVICAVVAGTLVTSGEQRRFTFSLTTPGQFMFDSLSAMPKFAGPWPDRLAWSFQDVPLTLVMA